MMLLLVTLVAFSATTTALNVTNVKDAIPDHYIVVLKRGVDVSTMLDEMNKHRKDVFYDADIKHIYKTVFPGFSAKLGPAALSRLLGRPEVESIHQDGRVHAMAVGNWGMDRIGQRILPLDGNYNPDGNGNGVNVYVLDTGILPQSVFFGGRAFAVYDSTGSGEPWGIDGNGHGTHCAGTVGADIFGVAPGVKLLGVRVLDSSGSGSNAGVIAGCEFVASNPQLPSVASMSLGGGASEPLDEAVRAMINAGVTTVVAAGNSAEDACYTSPARVNETITVGATSASDRRASFSNYGPCVDIFAPGVDIPSAWIQGPEHVNTISGTSMACPHVSGAAAIAMANAGSATMSPQEVKEALLNNATPGVVSDGGPGSPNRLLFVEETTK